MLMQNMLAKPAAAAMRVISCSFSNGPAGSASSGSTFASRPDGSRRVRLTCGCSASIALRLRSVIPIRSYTAPASAGW